MLKNLRNMGAVVGATLLTLTTAAFAGLGKPSPWQMNLQQSASSSMSDLVWFHDFLLYIIIAITLFVLGLLIYVSWRFSEKNNPVPSTTTHHVGLELAWTILPIVILVLIAIPSFKILYTQQDTSKPDITIKAIGKQWFWSYEYSDHGNISFDQMMVSKEDWEKGVKEKKIDPVVAPKLLAVDNEVVLPIGKKIKVNITAADVIHAWVVPSLGVKTDAVPGRMNAVWFRADKEGVFYGQCSELCGKDHAYMPIAVRIVSEEKFKEWLEVAKKKFASTTDERQFAAQTSK